jgi:amino acid adenylation domain-containing protein
MLFTTHHIVSDAWSMGVLVREFCALYQAMCEGKESPLPELEIQYADYAVWQRQYLDGGALEAEVGYWKEKLKGAAILELPTDHPRPAAPSFRGGKEKVDLSRELSEGLKRLSQREGATLFMTLMAAFKTLLMRYSGEEDISVGTAIANRTRKEIEALIGFFVNTLVMRTDLSGNPSFRELIKREREVALGAYGRQEAPFEKLVEEINPGRDLSRSPLFQVMMTLQNTGREELEMKGLKVSGMGEETGAAKFDLTLILSEGEEGITGCFEYSQDLFEGETIRRMARHYERVVEEVARDAGQRIREIELLREEERRQIVEEWNETRREYEEEVFAHEMIGEQARRNGEAIAIRSEKGELSYVELERRANQVGNYLRKKGVRREEVVGICADRTAEMVIGMLGVMKAGAAYAPIDGSYPEERVKYMLEDAGVKVVLTQGESGRKVEEKWKNVEAINLETRWEEVEEESDESPDVESRGENLAYVIYTSGSTGKPKGVSISRRSLANSTRARLSFYREPARSFLLVSPFGFDSSVAGIYWTLCQGGTLVLPGDGLERDPLELIRLVEENNISHLLCLPTLYSWVLTESRPGQLNALKCVIVAGEACPSEVVERHGARVSGAELYNEYGPTEGTVWSSVYGDCVRERRTTIPIGKPISNMRMYILDVEQEPAPIGVRGEIYIAGKGLARGYLGRPELTAERFVPNQEGEEEGGRVYRTGDVGRYLTDGNIEFIGRADEQVKLRGYRIELGEIQAALDRHPLVKQSFVMMSENARGDKRLLGYIVGESSVTSAELRKHLRECMPEYMVPEAIVILDEMPVNANGKVDRKKLPVVEDAGRQVDQEYVRARTPVEEMVVGIFEEVLKRNEVGIRDNFFEIGGHSLLATQVVSRVRSTFGVEIGVRNVFEKATVEGLARRIEDAMRAGERAEIPQLGRVSREGALPLSFAQQTLWFVEQLEPGRAIYNCPGAMRLEGKLNLEVLERAINEVVRRHEVLRTRIEEEEGEPVQIIEAWEYRKLEIEDLAGAPAERQEEEVRRIARDEARKGFDLRRAPLMRMKLLKLSDDQHVALFTIHHIVSDAWSMSVLTREVSALYQSMCEGKESPLPELEIQYADYASWQRSYLSGEVLDEHLQYWKKQLGGKLSLVDLAADRPRPLAPSYRGAAISMPLPKSLCEPLRAMSRQEGVTMFMVFLAAFKALLYKHTGQENIIVGTSALNRSRAELEPLIGFFVNTLPLRTDLSGNPRFLELLGRVKEMALGAYAHQELPFEKLVEEIKPERRLIQMPLFNIVFGMQNAPKEEARLSGLNITPVANEQETARFDLTLWITEGAETMKAAWVYSSDLFEEETIVRLHGQFEALLTNVVARPNARLDELETLSEAEKAQQATRRSIREESNYSKFKSVKPKAVILPEE